MLCSDAKKGMRFLLCLLLLVALVPITPIFAATLFSDDFESYSSFPQGGWVNATSNGSWAISQISTNLAKQTTTSSTDYMMTNGQSSWTNYTYQARIQTASTSSTTGIVGRYTDNNNYYILALNNGNVVLKKKVGGTTTTLQSAAYTFNTSTFYTLKLSLNGTTISGSVNGSQLVSVTDSSLTSGKIAIYSSGAGWWDDVLVSDIASSDTQAPTAPANLAATAISSSQINLSWNASTDNVGVSGYNVYRGSTLVGSPTTLSFSDTGLNASTSYSYTVKAKDAAGNLSAASNTASATTQAGGTQVTIANPGFENSFTGWTTSGSTAISTSDYHSGARSGKISSSGSQISQTISGLSTNTTYTLSAWILGQGLIGANTFGGSEVTIGGNSSAWTSISVSFTTGSSNTSAIIFARGTTSTDVRFDDFTITGGGGSSGDTQSPTAPTNLTATAASSSQINLSWTASTDNVGVTAYQVYRGSTLVGSPTATSFSDTGLSASTAYSYTVKAKDAAGNVSTASNTASATTQSGSTPTLPSQVLYLKNWKLTLPIPKSTSNPSTPLEIFQPDLDTYSINPWFKVVNDTDGYAVQFRANHGAVSTSGSKNPRSELREMVDNYTTQDSSSLKSWGTNDGKTHSMFIKQKVTHLTSIKPHTVVGQIHDADDDVTVFRVEGNNPGGVSTTAKIYITDGDNTHAYLLDSNYTLGTVFTVKVTASGGVLSYEYNGQTVPYTQTKNATGCYFKIGNYTQSNDTTAPGESPDAYAENWVYAYNVTHQ
ncbi:polysaccharide lyase family 7 protein [Paenibacillus radicis (ex Xue et al. 2023)]|uniref:Polysaccharide lyase family 7 protein n=1 Tax=Paenibacillus radicis (ex Xue et al. 2023) TaxID=2972489 RepID=A0ABT1YCR7_9BACL|nr:polysaccharide lyase family 7 protein [Paenibacillus radicis (ex Xue et al. 2023)]MCR8630971.1 polysaccharide lyase family 7 protein [Paenibacillus radicis (ex Xue et al. 2023)]